MKKTSLPGLLMIALGLAMLSSCGGDASSSPQPAVPTTAVIKILATGTLDPGTLIGGMAVIGILPAGVTVKATPDAQNPSILVTDSGVVVASGATGANASAFATYDSTTGKVSIQVYDQDGFGTGEFVTVTCDIAPETVPAAESFGLEGFAPVNLDGAPIDGLAAGLTVDLQ